MSDWQEVVDPGSGQVYYYNPVTQETSWTNPNADPATAWQEVVDASTGATYYYNPITQETSWERPSTAPSTAGVPQPSNAVAPSTPSASSLLPTQTLLPPRTVRAARHPLPTARHLPIPSVPTGVRVCACAVGWAGPWPAGVRAEPCAAQCPRCHALRQEANRQAPAGRPAYRPHGEVPGCPAGGAQQQPTSRLCVHSRPSLSLSPPPPPIVCSLLFVSGGVRAVAALAKRRGVSIAPAADLPDAALPADWQEVVHTESGQTYFYNSVTGETSWERPV